MDLHPQSRIPPRRGSVSRIITALRTLVEIERRGMRLRYIDRRSRKLQARRDRDSEEWGKLQSELQRHMRAIEKLSGS